MKPHFLLPLIVLFSCSTDLSDDAIIQRSPNYITYSPEIACAGQPVTVTFNNGYNNNCGTSRIQQRINDTWKFVKEGTPHDGRLMYSFTPPTAGVFRFRASWNKSGKNCPHENIKAVEEEPLYVINDCCRDFFTATAVCNPEKECRYAVELHFMTTVENWIAIIGQLPPGFEFCGLYDEDGNIIEEFSGNVMQITADFPACIEGIFFAYFTGPEVPFSFGKWTVKDMHEILYEEEPGPCEM